jgi:hypothetical protein
MKPRIRMRNIVPFISEDTAVWTIELPDTTFVVLLVYPLLLSSRHYTEWVIVTLYNEWLVAMKEQSPK